MKYVFITASKSDIKNSKDCIIKYPTEACWLKKKNTEEEIKKLATELKLPKSNIPLATSLKSAKAKYLYLLKSPKDKPIVLVATNSSNVLVGMYSFMDKPVKQLYIQPLQDFLTRKSYVILTRESKQVFARNGLIVTNKMLSSISDLAEGTVINSNVILANSNITQLPSNLTIKGYLDVSGSKLKELPKNLVISGDLFISKSDISEIPSDIKVGQDFYASYCKRLTTIPTGIFTRDIILSNSGINKLPKDLKVRSSLDLFGCENLKTLPKGLSVKHELNISNSAITALPQDLVVGGDLILSGTKVKKIPDTVTVGGELDITNTQITSIPAGNNIKGNIIYGELKLGQDKNNTIKLGKRKNG